MNNTHASRFSALATTLFCLFILSAFRPADSFQLNISVASTPSTCTNNGTVSITATGGSGNYKYKIQSPTLTLGPQDSNQFVGLAPGSYTVTVFDVTSGASATKSVTVGGNYVPMTLKITPDCTSFTAQVTGGLAPFSYAFSTVGASGPFGADQQSPTFSGLSPNAYWVRATDACGNSTVVKIQFLGNPGTFAPYWFPTQTGIKAWANGAVGPLSFTLTTGLGSFTNTTGEFLETLFDCSPATLLVTDGCQSKTYTINRTFNANLVCVSFQDGTATVSAYGGVPPYVFTCTAGPDKITSPDGVFTNLPLQSMLYTFKVEDACGKFKSMAIAPYSLRFPTNPVACDADTTTFWFERGCMRDVYAFPNYTTECTTCNTVPTATAPGLNDTIFVVGATPGHVVLKSTDKCGDEFICRDTLFLRVIAACDSIVAQPIDSFTCNDGQTSRRLISLEGMTFDLYGPGGALLAAGNTTGIFTGFTQKGNYRVVAHTPCGDLEGKDKLENPKPLNVAWKAKVSVRKNPTTGVCEHYYDLQIEFDGGNYVLTGGPNNVQIEVNEELAEWYNCDWFFEYDLAPGNYTLWSRTGCGSMAIPLPMPEYKLKATVLSDCPGSSTVKVSGALTYTEWNAWAQSKGLSWYPEAYNNGFKDHYTVNTSGASPTSPYTGNYTFYNVSPGVYNYYLYAHGGACPVDTATIEVLNHSKPTLYFPPAVVCDGQSTATAHARIRDGKAPFSLKQVNCNNPSQVLQSWQTSDSTFDIANLPLGYQCFRLTDACGNSADYNVFVGYLNNNIAYRVVCPNLLELSVDSLPATYIWRDESGTTIGYGSRLQLPIPPTERTFSVSVLLENCVVERSVTVPAQQGLDFQLTPANDLRICGGSSATITAVGNNMEDNTLIWSNGSSGTSITVTEPGVYAVTVTNPGGCTMTDQRTVTFSPVQTPAITGSTEICAGQTATLAVAGTYAQYLWANGTQTAELNIQAPGTYTVTATDAEGCEWTNTFTVTERPAPSVQIAGETEICAGQTTQLAATAGFPNYEWSNGQTTPTIEAGNGDHSVTVTDAYGCRGTATFAVAEIPSLNLTLPANVKACNGAPASVSFSVPGAATANGTAFWTTASGALLTSTVSNGQSELIFSPNADPFVRLDSLQITGLDCGISGLPAIVEISENTVLAEIAGDFDLCAGETGYLASATAFAQYQWSTGEQTQQIAITSGGSYALTVTDADGCTGTAAQVLVNEHAAPAPQITASANAICPGQTATLAADAGFAKYAWSDGTAEPAIQAEPGIHVVTVTDAWGCEGSATFTLEALPQLTVELQPDPSACKGDEVQITCTVSDPAANGTAFWTLGNGQVSTTPILQGQSVLSFSADSSTIVRLDSVQISGAGCPVEGLPAETSSDAAVLQLNISAEIRPNGLPISCFGANDGIVRAEAVQGKAPFDFEWEDGSTATLRENLAPGVYQLTITDANDCQAVGSIEIAEPAPMEVFAAVFAPRCPGEDNGSFTFDGIAGAQGTAKFSFNQFPMQPVPGEIGNLTAGTYSLQVTDGLCTLDTSIVVPESSSATLDYPDTISIIALGDSVLLRPLDTGFLSVDSVAWSPASLFSEPNELETWVHPDGTTRFKVEAWTPEGCHLSDWVLVLVDPTRHVFVPNVFHPGADDEDGRFNIFPDPSSAVKINWVRVFDRWGDMVYFGKNLSTIPGPTDGWDGTWRGKPASKGVYVWTAEIEFVDGKNELFTGSITLTR